ncbi:hypothetical protein CFP56_012746 [Quercus suber]|uniref:Uncharacterized protein n=1 Tax=Quercus suber TaxID=58331 RepID=A0AAW0KWQ1_QUESU
MSTSSSLSRNWAPLSLPIDSRLQLDVANGSNLGLGFDSTVGDGFDLAPSSMAYSSVNWNDRSSCLDLKLEINNNALWMGIDCNWEYTISSLGVSKSSQRKIKILQLCKPKHVLKMFREPSRSS